MLYGEYLNNKEAMKEIEQRKSGKSKSFNEFKPSKKFSKMTGEEVKKYYESAGI